MSVYKISRYPRSIELRDGAGVTLRPLCPADEQPLLHFFRQIPEDDRYFLKEDVTSPLVVRKWIEELNFDRILPLLALENERIVADAVLIRQRSGARSQAAEIRVVILPSCRHWGLGVALMRELIEIAYDAELEQVFFEFAEHAQADAFEAARFLGATEVGRVSDRFKDAHGRPEDAVFLSIMLGKWWEWSQF